MSEQLKILYNTEGVYPYDNIIDFFGFGKDNEIATEKKSLLSISPNNRVNLITSEYQDYYKIFFVPEEPNGFFTADSYNGIYNIENIYDLIFSICKYTTKWRCEYFGVNNRIHTFTPWSLKYIYPNEEKVIPVYFTAHNRPSPILPYMYNAVRNFGGRIVDASQHAAITHDEKMILNGKSKISITYNLLFLPPAHIGYVKSLKNWNKCGAFSHIDSGIVPQMKTRVYEAALSKSIIIHKRDMWNVIEDWYIPDEDFIYFDEENDLLEKIDEINKNYDKYKHIAENAYNKTINNYTTDHFINRFILPNTKLGAQ